MSSEDIRKLLGGYATGTLTEAEQQALFAAALEDQELFDALANEQPVRDLLTDPSARAALLSSLDTPARGPGGFWQWLRRPLVVGLSTASVVAIAVVAVWQGTRIGGGVRQPAPQIVAELRSQAPRSLPAPAEVPPPAMQSEAGKRSEVAETPPPTRLADEKAKSVIVAPPAPPPSSGVQALSTRKEETDAAAPAMAPPPQPAAPAAAPVLARKKEAVEVTASAPPAAQIAGAAPESVPLDARALFYASQVAQGANGFRAMTGQKSAAPRPERASAGLIAPMKAGVPRLGVRISILRAAGEVDLTTVLDPGETVRLKLIPNADGFLYIAEGARLVASGAVQRLRPFETPELRFTGSGQKQLFVMFSSRPQTVEPQSIGRLARGNLVETPAEQERATYVVSGLGDAATQQIIVPVTLTYR